LDGRPAQHHQQRRVRHLGQQPAWRASHAGQRQTAAGDEHAEHRPRREPRAGRFRHALRRSLSGNGLLSATDLTSILIGSDNASTTFTGTISGGGAIGKNGTGTQTLYFLETRRMTVHDGKIFMAPSGGSPSRTSSVSSFDIFNAARWDLSDNKLVTDVPAGMFNGSVYTGVQGEVQRAYDFGSWDMPGLTTSMPRAISSSGPTGGTATLAVAPASAILFIGPTETGFFGNQTVTGASTLVMYTYAGDVNLDGLVDASDYGVIDNYFQFPGTSGYVNGDLNYDGVIDAGDYGIIDNTFQLQGPPIPVSDIIGGAGGSSAASGAAVSGLTAVPEPSTLGLLLAPMATLLSHRRRRRCRCNRRKYSEGINSA
jgi:hypothetical protein